jgi:hypothetical protein
MCPSHTATVWKFFHFLTSSYSLPFWYRTLFSWNSYHIITNYSKCSVFIYWSWGSRVSLPPRLWAEQSGVQILVMAQIIFLCSKISRLALGPTHCPGYHSFIPGVKQQQCELNHAPPAVANVKNECSHTSSPPMSSWCGQGKLLPFIFVSIKMRVKILLKY